MRLDLPWMKWLALTAVAVLLTVGIWALRDYWAAKRDRTQQALVAAVAQVDSARVREAHKDSTILLLANDVAYWERKARTAAHHATAAGATVDSLEQQLAAAATAPESLHVALQEIKVLKVEVNEWRSAYASQVAASARLQLVADSLRNQRDSARAERDHLARLVRDLPPPPPPCKVLDLPCKPVIGVLSAATAGFAYLATKD